MQNKNEVWGQIGATFHLTDEETDTLLRFDDESGNLFATLVSGRRYEIDDQFYAPEFTIKDDLYISLNNIDRTDAVWAGREDQEQYPRKIWCRMGITLFADDQQMQALGKEDQASAGLIFDLIESGQYKVEGSCLFEAGNEVEGYDEPEDNSYIDLFLDDNHITVFPGWSQSSTDTGLKFT